MPADSLIARLSQVGDKRAFAGTAALCTEISDRGQPLCSLAVDCCEQGNALIDTEAEPISSAGSVAEAVGNSKHAARFCSY